MEAGYKFNNSDAIVALQHVRLLLKTSANCYALCFDDSEKLLKLYRFPYSESEMNYIEVENTDIITGLRRPKKAGAQWLMPGSLPFVSHSVQAHSLDIFAESDKTMLCLRIADAADGLHDLLVIDFRKDPGVFGVALLQKDSDVQYKDLLSALISGSVAAVLKQAASERLVFDSASKQLPRILDISQKHKAAAETEKKLHKQTVANLANEYAIRLSQEYGRNVIISEAAHEVLWEHRDCMHAMNNIVEDALKYYLGQFPGQTGAFVLHEEFFDFPVFEKSELREIAGQVKPDLSRAQKSEQFLYRLKGGVEKAMAQNLPLTGKIVGPLCVPPISAPGISEYLGKHKVSIANVINRNPERWKLLTSQFKPVQNIDLNAYPVIKNKVN